MNLVEADRNYVAERLTYKETGRAEPVIEAADALHEAVKAHQMLPHGTLEAYVDMACRCHFCCRTAELTLEAIRGAQKEREDGETADRARGELWVGP